MGAQAAVLLLVFFAQRIILTALTPEENGTLFLERRLTEMFVGLLADFGMNGVLLRRAAQEPERRLEIVASAVWLRIGLWAVTTFAVGAYVVATAGPVIDVAMWSLFLLIASRTTLLRYALEVQHRAASKFILPSIVSVVDALLFFCLIWLYRDQCSPTTVITLFLISAVPGFLVVAGINRGQALRPSMARLREMRSLAFESLPMVAFILLWGFQDKIDAAILEMFASRSDVGVLGAAYTSLGPIISLMPQTLALVALPEISRLMSTDSKQAISLASSLLRFTLLASSILTVVSIALIPAFIQYVSGGRYNQSTQIFELFVWTAPGIGLLVFTQETLVAMGRQRDTLWIAIAMLIGTVVGGFTLVPIMQVQGSVIAKLFASISGAAVALLVLHRATQKTLERGLMLRGFVFIAALVAVSCLLKMLNASALAYLVGVITVVAISATMLRIITNHEISLLWNLVTKARARS